MEELGANRSPHRAVDRIRDDEEEERSSSGGEFSDVYIGEDDGTSLRPPPAPLPTTATIVQVPRTRQRVAEPPNELAPIDPDVLKELPPELQQEILLEHAAAEKRATDRAIHEALYEPSHVDEQDVSVAPLLHEGPAATESTWVCHVCTFANHPELIGCEMCEAPRPDVVGWDDDQQQLSESQQGSRRRSGSGEEYSKLTQRIQSSVMTTSLKKIRMPATPATTSLAQKDEPTAEDLLIAATVKIQQLQSNASQSIQNATQSLLAKANGSRRPSLLSSASTNKPPSPQASAVLSSLQQDLSTKCELGDERYETLLRRLWAAIYQDDPRSPRSRPGPMAMENVLPRRPYERVSEGWVAIGFQGPNPDTDFRGGGLLALKCLVYIFEAYPHKMLEVVSSQKPSDNAKKWYPVCVAGINVTCMIAGLIRLGNGQFAKAPEAYWPLFEEPSAFYQLFFHAFVKMHGAWHRMNASFMEFGVVLKATRRMVVHMLEQAPRTLDQLNTAAEKTFIDRFVVSATTTFMAETENGECPDPFNLLEDESEVLVPSPRSALSAMASKLTLSPAPTATHLR